jgi:heme exporter protein D
MISEILLMNGYGLYVWSAFTFTLLSFVSLYAVIKIQYIREKNKFIKKFGTLNSERAALQNLKVLIKKFYLTLKYLTFKPCMVVKLN